jgi:hypothetical protein
MVDKGAADGPGIDKGSKGDRLPSNRYRRRHLGSRPQMDREVTGPASATQEDSVMHEPNKTAHGPPSAWGGPDLEGGNWDGAGISFELGFRWSNWHP